MIHATASNGDARRLSRSSSWCSQRNNPKYVGRQVWARTVAGRPVPVEQWVTSGPNAHEPLVDPRTFQRAQPHHDECPRDVTDPADDAPPSAA